MGWMVGWRARDRRHVEWRQGLEGQEVTPRLIVHFFFNVFLFTIFQMFFAVRTQRIKTKKYVLDILRTRQYMSLAPGGRALYMDTASIFLVTAVLEACGLG